MPYLGNAPSATFQSVAYQDLTGGTGTSFTLSHAVSSAQEIEVFVNNVRQEPTVAYTVAGTTLTMTGTIAATDDFYVVFQGKAVGSVSHPTTSPLAATTGNFTGNVTSSGTITASSFSGDGSALTGVSAGKVLQVAYGELTTKVSITSSTFVDTGLTASITPASASNYLIVIPSVNLTINNNGSITQLDITDSSNNSIVNNTDTLGNRIKGIGQFSASASISGFISFHNYGFPMKIEPATTSAVTYKVRCRRDGATATINSTGTDSDSEWHIRPISTLTIFEIEG